MNDELGKRAEGSGRQKDLTSRADDLDFMPETFREWISRSRQATQEGENWRFYTLLMLTYAEAFSRAPLTAADCERTDIIVHLDREIAWLSEVIHSLMDKDERERRH